MQMRVLKKDGSIMNKVNLLGSTPHEKNLDYLNRNIKLKNNIVIEVRKCIQKFLQDIKKNRKGYMNSADVAYSVSNTLNLQQINKYNLVGSILFEEIEPYDCSTEGLDKI